MTELSAASVAIVTHWNIYVRNGVGQIICVIDTKSSWHQSFPPHSALRCWRGSHGGASSARSRDELRPFGNHLTSSAIAISLLI